MSSKFYNLSVLSKQITLKKNFLCVFTISKNENIGFLGSNAMNTSMCFKSLVESVGVYLYSGKHSIMGVACF